MARVSDTPPRVISVVVSTTLAVVRLDPDLPMPSRAHHGDAGVDLVDTPDFPTAYKGEALAAREFLRLLRQEPAIDWTLVSPSALLQPGQRTGQFRIGGDQLLVDGKGASRISIEDLAMALVDELESPRHSRQRFTVGY